MRTKGAFLRKVFRFVPEDHPVRAGFNQLLLAHSLYRVDDDDPIRTLVYGILFGLFDTRRIFTVLTKGGDIIHLDLRGRYLTLNFINTPPEMPEGRLGLRRRHKFISHMFVLAGNLAVVTTNAGSQVYCHRISCHLIHPLPTFQLLLNKNLAPCRDSSWI